MRALVWYFRSAFCKHDWEREEQFAESSSEFGSRKGLKVSSTCKNCGWHRSYWKF